MFSGGFRPVRGRGQSAKKRKEQKTQESGGINIEQSPVAPPDLPDFDNINDIVYQLASDGVRDQKALGGIGGSLDNGGGSSHSLLQRHSESDTAVREMRKSASEVFTEDKVRPNTRQNEQRNKSRVIDRAMFMFFKPKHRQSKEAKKKTEHQLHVARISPDKIVDLSGCDLNIVPDGVYALCKVLLKEVLLLHTNRLTVLKESGSNYDEFVKLGASIRVLDAHNNKLGDIPPQIGKFTSLQVLNLSENQIREVPSQIGSLSELQTLNLKGNQIERLPDSIGDLKSLCTLDISGNFITRLPISTAVLQCLETIVLDVDRMEYPFSAVCRKGAREVLRFMCIEAGLPTPSLGEPLLPSMRARPSSSFGGAKSAPVILGAVKSAHWHTGSQLQLDKLAHTAVQYEAVKEARRKEQLKMEKVLLESQAQHSSMVHQARQNRSEILNQIATDQCDIDQRISNLHARRDAEKKALLDVISTMECHTTSLISDILSLNKDLAQTERILEDDERIKMAEDQWFKVKREEYERLRKNEIEKAMEAILAQNFSLDELRERRESAKGATVSKVLETERRLGAGVETVLATKDAEMRRLLAEVADDERLQMDAVLALMEQRDTRSNRLNAQIDLLHAELAQLSRLEMQSKDARVAAEQECLEHQRLQLMALLMQLMEERGRRSVELKKRLTEMERANEDHLLDYWLVQYQKLLDAKPQPLVDREITADDEVVMVLEKAKASEYLPSFVRHNITRESLALLDENDLQRMGIYQIGLRKKVLEAIAKLGPPAATAKSKAKGAERGGASGGRKEEPSPRDGVNVVAAHFEMECVICLDVKASLLFVPCGHVCSCEGCGVDLVLCPLCRTDVQQKVDLLSRAPSAPPAK